MRNRRCEAPICARVVIALPGGVEGIELQEVAMPAQPTGDRVRVRVHAAGLNRADILQRRGHYPPPPGYPENIPGLEFAGESKRWARQRSAGKSATAFSDSLPGKAQAEFVIVAESNLADIPAQLSWVEAAAMPEPFVTAHDALFTRARLQKGETVSFTPSHPASAQPRRNWRMPLAPL